MDATRKATIDENHSESKRDKKRSECIKQQRNIVCLNGAVADELEGEVEEGGRENIFHQANGSCEPG